MKKTIESIIGHESFNRLKARNLTNPSYIKNIPPRRLMDIAGIGPKKASELYKFVGKKYPMKTLEKEYRRIKNKTFLKRVRGNLKKTIDDPSKAIRNIEDRRKELSLWQNLYSSVRNIGKEDSEKIPNLTYAPVDSTLDPFSIQSGEVERKDRYFAEVFVKSDFDSIKIDYRITDTKKGEVVSSDIEYIRKKGSAEMATELKDTIKDMYERYREKTLVGQFIIIFDEELNKVYNVMLEQFSKEIQSHEMIFIPSKKEYHSWEALWKYQNNDSFEILVNRFNNFLKFVQYDKAVSRGYEGDFDSWKEDFEGFWDIVTSNKESYVKVNLPNNVVYFGLLVGMPFKLENKKNVRFASYDFVRINNYNDYIAAKREAPVNVGDIQISGSVMSLIMRVFDGLDAFEVNGNLLVRSRNLPEIGIFVDKGGAK